MEEIKNRQRCQNMNCLKYQGVRIWIIIGIFVLSTVVFVRFDKVLFSTVYTLPMGAEFYNTTRLLSTSGKTSSSNVSVSTAKAQTPGAKPTSISTTLKFVNTTVKNETKGPDKYVFYVCDGGNLCGGFGDRQKGIVAAYLISLMMERKFGVWFTKPCNLNTMFDPNIVQWNINPDTLKTRSSKKIVAIDGYSAQLREKLKSMDLNKEYKEDVLYFSLNLEFVRFIKENKLYKKQLGWMDQLSVSEVYKIVWERLFKLKPDLQKRIEPFQQLKTKGLKVVGAQIRMGRNPSVPTDSEIRNNINNIQILWNFYKKYNDSSKYRIFITTDSENVRLKAKELFPAVFMDIAGKIVHVERSSGSDVCEGFKKVILDQVVLSLCDVLVVSKSGFGRIGAFFRHDENSLYCLKLDKLVRCTTQSPYFSETSW
ncbi:uncharacterized protein LOC126815028 isoform X2 [Patella vulgata]|uniref:uncharacterized protein LOC126815028 isoform X2 n=1 Tax=Patella vulgata TaxID=6465 RepID=UPI0024A940EA|nr:uncharacterized protein LOC126815028 isoform X2 [Patella vulgata]